MTKRKTWLLVGLTLFLLFPTLNLWAQEQGSEVKWGWLLPNVNTAPYSRQIDQLYLTIMYLVLAMFVITEGALLFFIIRYRHKPGRRATYTHGNKKAELIWSVIPGGILLWLALSQLPALAGIKNFPSGEKDPNAVVVQSFPRQFAWWFRYRDTDKKLGLKETEVITNGKLAVPVNKNVLVKLSAKDVIHSFFLPYARIKQDAVPGMLTKAWFRISKIPCWNLRTQQMELLTEEEFKSKKVALGRPDSFDPLDAFNQIKTPVGNGRSGQVTYRYEPKENVQNVRICYNGEIQPQAVPVKDVEYMLYWYEIACAELCGPEHYTMRGILVVMPEGMMKSWMEFIKDFDVKGGEEWNTIWDKYHPEFN